MKKSILDLLGSLPYFTIEGAKQLFDDGSAGEATVRTALYRWMKVGQVIQLKNGIYMARRFFELHRGDEDFSPAISAIILPQSYVSLEFILQRYSILTEVTYPVSAVTVKNTRVIENDLGTFSYRHVKTGLYHGFTISEYHGIPFAQASVAKALFDYLYLRPWSAVSTNLAEELRLNLEDFSPSHQEEFSHYVITSESQKMVRILKNLRRTIWRP